MEHFCLARACRMEWVSLCVPTRVENALQLSETGFSVETCPYQAWWAQPQEMQAHEFHGSAWNLKPGPHPGFRWEDVVTQKSISLSKWKIPFHPSDNTTRIQKKALVWKILKQSSSREVLQSPTDAGLRNILLHGIGKITYPPCSFPCLSQKRC